jgi:hypothetical protein
MDFQIDATANGRRLKCLYTIDEHSRLCLAIRVSKSSKAKDLMSRSLTFMINNPPRGFTLEAIQTCKLAKVPR